MRRVGARPCLSVLCRDRACSERSRRGGDSDFTSAKTKWVPHLSPILRKVGTPHACSVGFAVDVVFARVERTLFFAAFDVEDAYQGMPSGIPPANTIVEERRFSAA